MNELTIGNRTIAPHQTPFVIAEAGINHNGDLANALKMVDAALSAGVDAIKFQTFKAEQFCSDPKQMFTYKSQGEEVTESMLYMFKRMEFSFSQWKEIKQYCDDKGIMFLSTPQNVSDLELLLDIGISAIKVGSDDFNNIPLLKTYQQTNLPMIVSCGMANLADVHNALSAIGTLDGYPTILCLCTSQYPTPPQDINLEKLRTLKAAFPSLTLGFSDHSQGPLASSLAVTYGVSLFEKHFTLDNNMAGPDHWFSENPQTLKLWCESIHLAHQMKGSGTLRATAEEEKMKVLARRSIVVLKDIKQGEILTLENIGLRRPGDGLPPILLDKVLSLFASKSLKRNEKITLGDICHESTTAEP